MKTRVQFLIARAGGSAPLNIFSPLIVIARCAKRAVAIQLDCFVAALLAMTQRNTSVKLALMGLRSWPVFSREADSTP